MSNKIVNSESSSSLNPSDKFEKVFLIIPSKKPISSLQEINEKTVYGYGTGFFINERGLFLSVAHNFFDKESKDKKDFKYVYALLRKQDGNHNLIEIKETDKEIDKDTDYAIGKIDTDYAIGKINVSFDYLDYKLYEQEKEGTVHGLKDRKLIGVLEDNSTPSSEKEDCKDIGNMGSALFDNEDDNEDNNESNENIFSSKTHIKDIPFHEKLYDLEYFKNDNLTFYPHSIVFNIIDFDKNVGQCKTQHKFKDISYFIDDEYVEKYRLDERPFEGLSGSPILNNTNKIIGIHQKGGVEVEYNYENKTNKGLRYLNKMIPIDETLNRFIQEYIQKI